MSERDGEDLELEALQRQLDDAFETTRPRRGFEDELWLRMQRRRPFGVRLRDAFAGLVAGVRQAPAVPIAAVALILVAVIGVSVLNYSALLPGGSGHKEGSTAAGVNGAPAPRSDMYAGGQIPTPALHPGLVAPLAPSSSSGGQLALGSSNLYFGPANLTWSGTFASTAIAAPVFIYAEPNESDLRSAAVPFGPAQDATVETRGSVAQLPLAPSFILTELNAGVAGGTDPVQAASSFLQEHNALPPWPNNVVVNTAQGVTYVVYQRAFNVQNGDLAFLVDWNGDRYGTAVTIAGGKRVATGPLPLGLQAVSLPLISNSDAAQLAISRPPAATAAITPTPTVALDNVELVYALAISGRSGFYEPAYLFSGSFTYNGQSYVKRVLVPLVVPSLRS